MARRKESFETLEEMQAHLKELNAKGQDQFIDKIYDEIDLLCEKANRKDYEPTDHEREVFGKIVVIVSNMNKWF